MEYFEWEPIYQQILADFKFDRRKDESAANVLKDLLKTKDIAKIEEISKLLNDKTVNVFGAGPSLDSDILEFESKPNEVIIAADGATSALIQNNIIPNIIITDLDGHIPDQLEANEKGAIVIVHAHGDNISTLKRWVPEFKNNLLGTTQSKPDEANKIYNFGGFTDGDRAIFLASHFKARKINLIAFNFKKIGKYSYKYHSKTKLRKLTWANLLIGMIKTTPIAFQPPQT